MPKNPFTSEIPDIANRNWPQRRIDCITVASFTSFPQAIAGNRDLRSHEMKQFFSTIARTLVAAANGRAEHIMRTHAEARTPYQVSYSANAGGWN
jgi:hypothetical protein